MTLADIWESLSAYSPEAAGYLHLTESCHRRRVGTLAASMLDTSRAAERA